MTDLNIPSELIEDIECGRCVAFVGAGFSAAASLPTWGKLLQELSETPGLDAEARNYVLDIAGKPGATAHELDQAAQLLEDSLGRVSFIDLLRKHLDVKPESGLITKRLEWLRQIPFRAIVTTNFDPVLQGEIPGALLYRNILRPERYRWWEAAFWDNRSCGAPVIKIHGDITSPDAATNVVLTRRDYRRRLYGDPSYMTFLRGLLSTNTILFMGFSFGDAYLNELRSQVLSLFDWGNTPGAVEASRPLAYAILKDVPSLVKLHFARHESIHVLDFDSNGGEDFSGFDQYLRGIWERSALLPRFGRLMSSKSIFWLDPAPDNNEAGFCFLKRAASAGGSGGKSRLLLGASVDDFERHLADSEGVVPDLIITHWGEKAGAGDNPPAPRAIALLRFLRSRDIRCPVIVFGSARDAEERRRCALDLGAFAYCFRWETLFRTMDELFRRVDDTGPSHNVC